MQTATICSLLLPHADMTSQDKTYCRLLLHKYLTQTLPVLLCSIY